MKRLLVTCAVTLAALIYSLPIIPAQGAQEARPLEPGKPVERELTGGQTHAYQLTLAADQYLHLIVEQRGIDVVVALTGPDGQKLVEVDSPNGMVGPEPVSFVAEAPGNYWIEVRSPQSSAVVGRYEMRITELRAATDVDRNRVAAERAFMAGMQLQFQGTAESLARSIEKYEEALPLYRTLGDRLREAQTLFGLGRCNVALDERRKALGYYNQSLAIYRSLSDREMEVAALTNIGLIYHNLGEYQQALDHYVRALPLNQAAGERRAEAATLNNIGLTYHSLGEYRRALDYFHQALPVSLAVGHRWQEAITLGNIGLAHDALDERQKALDYFQQALTIQRAIGERRQEAITLGNIGTIYAELGERQKALESHNQALPLNRTVGARRAIIGGWFTRGAGAEITTSGCNVRSKAREPPPRACQTALPAASTRVQRAIA
jgi:tetratricopeptide (TPR) repeat protein